MIQALNNHLVNMDFHLSYESLLANAIGLEPK